MRKTISCYILNSNNRITCSYSCTRTAYVPRCCYSLRTSLYDRKCLKREVPEDDSKAAGCSPFIVVQDRPCKVPLELDPMLFVCFHSFPQVSLQSSSSGISSHNLVEWELCIMLLQCTDCCNDGRKSAHF